MTKKTRRNLLISLSMVFSAFALAIGGIRSKVALATVAMQNDVKPAVSMVEGASVRMVNTDTEGTGNGLRFTMQMTKADYKALKEDSKYTDVTFGVLVAPSEAEYQLTYDNVFGVTKKYDWATWDGEKWVYTGTNTDAYTQIMNFESKEMFESTYAWENDNNVYLRGSVTDLDTDNVTREFQGVGYVTYKYDNVSGYVMTNAEERSMTYVAQLAVEAGDVNATWLTEKYITPYQSKSATYQEAYYLEQADGSYKLETTETVSSTVNAKVTDYQTALSFHGYEFDSANANNVSTGTVYANGQLTLKKYMKFAAGTKENLGLMDVSKTATQSVDLTGIAKGLHKKLYRVWGENSTLNACVEVTDVDLSGDSLDIAQMEGAYRVVAAKMVDGEPQTVSTIDFDAYHSENELVWADPALMQWSDAEQRTAYGVKTDTQDAQTTFALATEEEKTAVGALTGNFFKSSVTSRGFYAGSTWSVRPMHSKAYYQQFAADTSITFQWWFNIPEQTSWAFYEYGNTPDSGSVITANVNQVYSTTIPVSDMLEEWDILFTDNAPTAGKYWLKLAGENSNLTQPLSLFIGNITLNANALDIVEERDTTVEMIDDSAAGANAYDLTSLVSVAENKKALAQHVADSTWIFTRLDGTYTYEVKGNTADITAMAHGLYLVQASVGTLAVYTGEVDIYNPDVFEWVDWSNGYLSDSVVINKELGKDYSATAATDEELARITATAPMAKAHILEGNYEKQMKVKIRPVWHSKGYYQLFAEETLRFDWYLEQVDSKGNIIQSAQGAKTFVYGSASSAWKRVNQLHTSTILVGSLLAEWDNLMDSGSNQAYLGTAWLTFDNGGFQTAAANLNLYLGNVRIAEA